MSGSSFQSLLMESGGGLTPVDNCEVDPYYSTGPENDPYWNNVVLLLHLDGANLSTVITDSSTAATTVTTNGNAALSTEQAKFGTTSLKLTDNGGADFLSISANPNFTIVNRYTVEMYIYLTLLPSTAGRIFGLCGTSTGVSSGWGVYISTTDRLAIRIGSTTVTASSGTFTTGQWYNIAVAFVDGGTTRLFVDGVQVQTTTNSVDNTFSGTFYIGKLNHTASQFVGYIDELRITSKAARYFGNYSYPNLAYPEVFDYFPYNSSITDGTLLFHEDFSSGLGSYTLTTGALNNFEIVSESGRNILKVSHGGTAASTSIISKEISTVQPTKLVFDVRVDGFNTSVAGAGATLSIQYGTIASLSTDKSFAPRTTQPPYPYDYITGNDLGDFTLSTGVWYTVVVWDVPAIIGGPLIEFYLSGALVHRRRLDYQRTARLSDTVPGYFLSFMGGTVNRYVYASYADVKIYRIEAGYNILLSHAENTDDSAYRQPKSISLTGLASISSAQKKFGASSFLSVNTGAVAGNGIQVAPHSDFNFLNSTGDFTLSLWAYRNNNTRAGVIYFLAGASSQCTLSVGTDGLLDAFFATGTTYTRSNISIFPVAQWVHIAVQRRNLFFEIYLDGSLVDSFEATGPIIAFTQGIFFGRRSSNSNDNWDGYLDEIQYTYGVARYSGNFTPPDKPWCDDTVVISTSGTEYPRSATATIQQGSLTLLNHYQPLSGQFVTFSQGTLAAGGVAPKGVNASYTVSEVFVVEGNTTIPMVTYLTFKTNGDLTYVGGGDVNNLSWLEPETTSAGSDFQIYITDTSSPNSTVTANFSLATWTTVTTDKIVTINNTAVLPGPTVMVTQIGVQIRPVPTSPNFGNPYYERNYTLTLNALAVSV